VYSALQLDAYPDRTADAFVTFTGSAPGAASVEICANDTLTVVGVGANDEFSVGVPLVTSAVNRVFFTALYANGTRSAVVAALVTQDEEEPFVWIDAPVDGELLIQDLVDVMGRAGDRLSGAEGLTIDVNGVAAEFSSGIGPSGTFLAKDVPLVGGANTLRATAIDALGNSATHDVVVSFAAVPTEGVRTQAYRGDRQSGPASDVLGSPLEVIVFDVDGTPMVGKLVTFRVSASDGVLAASAAGPFDTGTLQVRSGIDGVAGAHWRLGSDAGTGNQRVVASVSSAAADVTFCATALASTAAQINIGSGDAQSVSVGAPAPEPLRAWVSDGCNGMSGVPVIFAVVEGGGFVDGFDSVTVVTGPTGHAEASFLAGPDAGQNLVLADFGGNQEEVARFRILGVEPDTSGSPASFAGLVLDNSGNPIGGADCSVLLAGNTAVSGTTTVDGIFSLAAVPPGAVKLHVDGSTATTLAGGSIPQGTYPSLEFEVVVVDGVENSLRSPVLLPRLNPSNIEFYSTTQDTVLGVDGVEGLEVTIEAGSMSIDGAPAADGVQVSLNQVHHDEVPMPIPDGAAPLFAWTLQPAGATFDPPATIRYPNMSGLAPGSASFFLSFDHDLGQFSIVGTGRVDGDGAHIVSDAGSGLTKGGWGCNCPPYAVTGECESCCPLGIDNCMTIDCCEDGPTQTIGFNAIDLPLGPYTVPIVGWQLPKVCVDQVDLQATRQFICCPGIEIGQTLECAIVVDGSFDTTVQGPFTLPVPLGMLQAIEKVVCGVLDKATFGVADCNVTASVSLDSVRAQGFLAGANNGCTGVNGWAGSGALTASGLGGTVNVGGSINSIPGCGTVGFSATLALTDTVSASLVANGSALNVTLSNAGPTLSGEIVVDLCGNPKTFGVSHQFTSFSGSANVGSVPLPGFPSCGP
jgi:hypothetical protein